MDINNRIKALREIMKEKNLDAFIIPSSDNHLSEYVGDYFKCREWISGFTGSAGTAIVTLDEAHLWVDGRYYIQAEKQVKGSEYVVEKLGMPNVDNFPNWLFKNLNKGNKVGFNGKVMSVSIFNDLQKTLNEKGIEIKVEDDLINKLWKDRPSMPFGKLFIHDTKYTGKTAIEKITEVRERLAEENVNCTVISSLDDIAWLLNLRGRDIPCNPVFLSYVLLSKEKCTLYIDNRKIDNKIINYLSDNGVDVKQYDDIEVDLSATCC